MRAIVTCCAFALFAAGTLSAQVPARPDTLRGKVVSDSGAVIPGATVSATRAPDRQFLQTTTDASGAFRIIFAEGTGDYLVHASATGYRSARVRVTRASDSGLSNITLKLASEVQQLAPVEVQAKRPAPSRPFGFSIGTGEAGRLSDGVRGTLSPEQAGNLEAIALTMPGITSTSGGFSALGMPSSSNGATLGGMSFAGGSVPRDLQTRTAVSTSTYDPSRGWFSGAETSIDISAGDLFSRISSHVTLNTPALQASQSSLNGTDNEFTSVDAGLGSVGAFHRDELMHNFGAQGRVRTVRSSSFDDAASSQLKGAGISPELAAILRPAFASAGIPLSSRNKIDRAEQSVSIMGRVDRSPIDWATFKTTPTTWSITGFGNFISNPAMVVPTSTIGTAEEQRSLSGGAQLAYSSIHKDRYLFELRSTISGNSTSRNPVSEIPLGIVRAHSQHDSQDSLFTSVGFGGSGSRGSDDRTGIWETRANYELWAPRSTKHYLRFAADSRFDASASSRESNSLGTFVFNSIEDFQNNRPASFTRTLFERNQDAAVWNGFLSASDSWRVRPNLRLLYGARFETNRFLSSPEFNRDLYGSLGVRNDETPNTTHVSPRAGFSWTRKTGSEMQQYNSFGNFYRSTARTIRGGIGEFRDFLAPALIADPRTFTGLDDGTLQFQCIGSSAPIPDWEAYLSGADAPRGCIGGAANNAFADTAPRVELIDKNYTAARSWRANLSYTSQYKIFFYTVQGTYSLGRSMNEFSDRNFSGNVRFNTPDGRPVYVPASSIDPRTGILSAQSARITDDYGSVIAQQSTARSQAKQLSLNVLPVFRGFWRLHVAGSYAISSSSYTGNGFSSSTFVDPRIVESTRSSFDARHQIRVQAGAFSHGFVLTMYGRVQSGLPFTPIVASDVNGDGLVNDRAFVFDPAAGGEIGKGIAALMASSSGRVKKCLERQSGAAARRNSCSGPWTASMNAEVSSVRKLPIVGSRGVLRIVFANPLGGIDQLVHGSKALRGWGSTVSPDRTLLRVNGFDPQSSSFVYQVNPEFGSTRRSRALNPSPFGVTIDLTLDLGRSLPTQQLERSLNPGRNSHPGARLTVADLKKRYARSVNDPYLALIEESDSLLLSREQTEAIDAAHKDYLAGMDSIWTPLAETLAALPDKYDSKAALKIQEDAIDRGWEYSRLHVRRVVPTILNPLQMNIAPGTVTLYLKSDKPIRVRTYTY